MKPAGDSSVRRMWSDRHAHLLLAGTQDGVTSQGHSSIKRDTLCPVTQDPQFLALLLTHKSEWSHVWGVAVSVTVTLDQTRPCVPQGVGSCGNPRGSPHDGKPSATRRFEPQATQQRG